MHFLRRLYRPEFFQGSGKRGGYFEGWYFKYTFGDSAFALIPGISLAERDRHAFIQVIDGPTGRSAYHRFPAEEFRCRGDRFLLSLGDNHFSLEGVRVRLPGFEAELTMSGEVRWPSALLSPSSMGWYAFLRFMECYHGIVVLDAEAWGRLNGTALSGGRFYLEKDWGSSFPRAWIWMQSNRFAAGPACVTCSVARVPFRGREFSGFIAGLWAQGRLHRFATYNGAVLERAAEEGGTAEVALRRGGLRLELRAARRPGAELASPVLGEMRGRIVESLTSEIGVLLSDGGRRLFEGTGRCAGLEVVQPRELERGSVGLNRAGRNRPRTGV